MKNWTAQEDDTGKTFIFAGYDTDMPFREGLVWLGSAGAQREGEISSVKYTQS